MKFQDSSFKGFKVTVGTKSVTHPRNHPKRSKSNMPHQLFQSWGHNKFWPRWRWNKMTQNDFGGSLAFMPLNWSEVSW